MAFLRRKKDPLPDSEEYQEVIKDRDFYKDELKKHIRESWILKEVTPRPDEWQIQRMRRGPQVIRRKWKVLRRMYDLHRVSPELSTCTGKLKQEVFRGGTEWQPRFVKKCIDCGKEHDAEIDQCESCKKHRLRDPDHDQYRDFDEFMKSCNLNDQEFLEVCGEIETDLNVVDDGYLLILKDYISDKDGNILYSKVKEIMRGDPMKMRLVADEKATPGGLFWTCLDHREYINNGFGRCITCGKKLHEIYHVSIWGEGTQSSVREYFLRGEVIHDSKYAPTKLYSANPPVGTLHTIAFALNQMNIYIALNYFTGRKPKGVAMITTNNKTEALELWETMQKRSRADPHYVGMVAVEPGETGKGEMKYVSFQDSLNEMAYREVRDEMRQRIFGYYGVAPVMAADTSVSGGLNNEGLQIAVTNRAIELAQRMWNTKMFPRLLKMFKITDFDLVLVPSEEEDLMAETQRDLAVMQHAEGMYNMGFEVTYKAESRTFEFSEKPTRQPSMGMEGFSPYRPALQPSQRTPSPRLTGLPESLHRSLPADDPPMLLTNGSTDKMAAPFGTSGGKARMASSLVELTPEHDTFVEAFSGAASYYFKKDPDASKSEVLNDLDKETYLLLKFFRDASSQEINDLKGREWRGDKKMFLFMRDKFKVKTPLDQIYKTLYMKRHSFMYRGQTWRGVKNDPQTRKRVNQPPSSLDRLEAYKERLSKTKLFNKDYRDIISKFDSPTTFFYLDPPYDEDMVEGIIKTLKEIKGKWLLSFSYNKELAEGLKEFNVHILDVTRTINKPEGETRPVQKEILAANYPIAPTKDFYKYEPMDYADLGDVEFEDLQKADYRDERQIQAKFREALEKAYNEEFDKILEYKQKIPQSTLLEKVNDVMRTAMGRMKDITNDYMRDMYDHGLRIIGNELDVNLVFDRIDEEALNQILQHDVLYDAYEGMDKELTSKLNTVITEAYEDPRGFTINDLVDTMKQNVYAEEYRLHRIARTESHAASVLGRASAYEKADPEGTYLFKWHGPTDSRTTDICKEIVSIVNREGGAVSLRRLEEICRDVSYKHNGANWDYRKFVPHINCRWGILRVVRVAS
jgi:DNA adenine methylase